MVYSSSESSPVGSRVGFLDSHGLRSRSRYSVFESAVRTSCFQVAWFISAVGMVTGTGVGLRLSQRPPVACSLGLVKGDLYAGKLLVKGPAWNSLCLRCLKSEEPPGLFACSKVVTRLTGILRKLAVQVPITL